MHVEKGVIEKVSYKGNMKIPHYHIQFKDNRKVTSISDMLRSTEETDMATIPMNPKQFIEYSRMLIEEKMKNLQHPLPPSKLEKERIKIHNQYENLSFSAMDKLVTNNTVTRKFHKLKGKNFLCPSCAFGKMLKKAWQTKGSSQSI